MNFDDRLRNHLHTQNDDLVVPAEGVDAVHARSTHRKHRRLAGGALAAFAIVLAVGVAATGIGSNDSVDFATDGGEDSVTTTTPADAAEPVAQAAPAELESVLPEPGEALSLAPVSSDGAPGGYNLYTSGSADGVYFVVSTAPGSRLEDVAEGGWARPDTVYSFDGSEWTNQTTATGDRFVSNIEGAPNGVLYAVSTGTQTDVGLSIGSSTNSGANWEWTPIDLSAVFGADSSTWPAYSVTQAIHEDQRLVVVATFPGVDFDEAFELANANGAGIAEGGFVTNADANGITWIEAPETTDEQGNPNCLAIASQKGDEAWSKVEEPEPPFEWDAELTPEEQAEVDAWIQERQDIGDKTQRQILDAVEAVEGCERFVECSRESTARQQEVDIRVEKIFKELGLELGEVPADDQLAALEAAYEAEQADVEAWLESSGCSAELNYLDEPDVEQQYRTWDELGVVTPADWKPIQNAFLTDGDVVTNLGDPFASTGFLVDVDHNGSAWNITFDNTSYEPVIDGPVTPTFVEYSSTDGTAWTSKAVDDFTFRRNSLADGSSFGLNFTDEQSSIVRRDASGSAVTLNLASLAPDLDTAKYGLANIGTGEYGVVAWATRWNESDGSTDSILLYSPDGQGWGATELPDTQITHVIVGEDGVIVFASEPGREPGDPQTVLFGTA